MQAIKYREITVRAGDGRRPLLAGLLLADIVADWI